MRDPGYEIRDTGCEVRDKKAPGHELRVFYPASRISYPESRIPHPKKSKEEAKLKKVAEAFGRGIGLCRRGIRKPPRVIADRLISEVRDQAERFLYARRTQRIDKEVLLRETKASDLDSLWSRLAEEPYPARTRFLNIDTYERLCPGDKERIFELAGRALGREVDLLGSGRIFLGENIDWQKDYKTGYGWPNGYFRTIEYNNPERPSDVKFAWELSRLQWLIPVGQAYVLTRNERYARAVRGILSDWIKKNPYAHTVNWACTMEVAIRAITCTWLFHVFSRSPSWTESSFRVQFLRSLYLHGDFIERHLEKSDINGNHYTADAAGLVFLGLFWGRGKKAKRWLDLGWKILKSELPRQVFPDGVDFEASIPYHRLVTELFLLPALYREKRGLDVDESYRRRLIEMARFVSSYSREDGSVPLWGDADDARTLPFLTQHLNDHRYLIGLVAAAWGDPELRGHFSGPITEILWLLGPDGAESLGGSEKLPVRKRSKAFRDGGFFIMRNKTDHIFIDCGPVGLAGRGGHGHNDCLSFEAVLEGTHIVSDCGAYLYTASYSERNKFRSSAYHNTPVINGEEINRFPKWNYIWSLENDALPSVGAWETTLERDFFQGSHSGYKRLARPVVPRRKILLHHKLHTLIVNDEFEGEGEHTFSVPLHLAPGLKVRRTGVNRLALEDGKKSFVLAWSNPNHWSLEIGPARISPSYGVVVPSERLCWNRCGFSNIDLTIVLSPKDKWQENLLEWAAGQVK